MFAAITGHAVYTLDLNGRVMTWSSAAERVHGYRAADMLGRHFRSLCTEEEAGHTALDDALKKALREGRCKVSGWGARKDDERFRASLCIDALRGDAGDVIGYVVLLSDVSEHDKIEHDCRNFLHVVKAGLEVLRRGPQARDSYDQALNLIEQNSRLAADLTLRLLGKHPRHKPAADAGQRTSTLSGLRIMVVEDESLIAMHLEDLLSQLECKIIGVACSVEMALQMARADMDFALLDVNLRGEHSYPVAKALHARGIPFAFMSGQEQLDERWRRHPSVQKPFQLDDIRMTMERALTRK